MRKILALTLLVAAGPVQASRNASGTYSLPAGQPVVSGTTISSSTFNALTADLATEVTSSLDRSGRGGMLQPLKLADGSVSAPAWSFTSEPGSGVYRAAANDLRLSIGGTARQAWGTTGSTITGTLGVSSDFAVATSKFTVAASSGNTLAAGTLSSTGDFAVNTDKFTVAASSGNALVAGTLDVNGSEFRVATNKFTVAGASGNTVIAGTLNVTGTITGNLTGNVTGNVSGTAGGLSGSPNITVGTISSGVITQGGATLAATYAPLAGVAGGWSVGGALSAASATINGSAPWTAATLPVGVAADNVYLSGARAWRHYYDIGSYANIFADVRHNGDATPGLEITNVNSSANRSITFSGGTTYAGRTTYATVSSTGLAVTGKLGVGATPTYDIDASSSGSTVIRAVTTGAGGAEVGMVASTGSVGIVGAISNHPLQLVTNNTMRLQIPAAGIPTYADNTAAAAGGLAAGTMYRTAAGVLMVVY